MSGHLTLANKTGASIVYGPNADPEFKAIIAKDNEVFEIGNITLTLIHTPGHTLDHLSYFANAEEPILFCGDTLFSGGCGRLFEGTPKQMLESLTKFSQLPSDTKVFCTHEYTESNLKFAVEVEPNNTLLNEKYSEVRKLRSEDKITLPSSIGTELNINPFMRCNQASVIEAAQAYSQTQVNEAEEVLGVIRGWKDNF